MIKKMPAGNARRALDLSPQERGCDAANCAFAGECWLRGANEVCEQERGNVEYAPT
jgi:hypothetical protein